MAMIAHERHGVRPVRGPDLEHHRAPMAKSHLGAGEMERPHAAEPLVVQRPRVRAGPGGDPGSAAAG
jgi:hypothetical protein